MMTEPNAQRARLPECYRLNKLVAAKVVTADLAAIDELAQRNGVSRSTMVRRLIAKGLAREVG